MPLQGPLGLRDGHWKTALRRLDCSAPDVGLVDAIARVDIKVTKVGAGILSNLAIHAWVCVCNEWSCCNESGRKESSREAQLPVVGAGDVLLAPGVGVGVGLSRLSRVNASQCEV